MCPSGMVGNCEAHSSLLVAKLPMNCSPLYFLIYSGYSLKLPPAIGRTQFCHQKLVTLLHGLACSLVRHSKHQITY